MRDPYEVLGVERHATPDELKAAFRKLAAKFHPDRNPGDPAVEQRFKEINAAYQLLSDPQKRAMFDRFGQGGGAGAPGGFPGGMPFDFADFAQNIPVDGIFGDLLEKLGIKTGDKGDLQREVTITLEEAAFGVEKEVTYERVEPCGPCSGSGSKPGSKPNPCTACGGRGRVRIQQGILPIAMERECSRCGGRGRIVVDACTTCRGSGVVSKQRTIVVTIPPGVENGATRLVERGGSSKSPDRGPGDLEIIVKVAPHAIFKRAGEDVVCVADISFPHACLGGDVEVPTLDGKGRLRVPAGTQPGTVLRIRGKGIAKRTSGRGDQLVEVRVHVPQNMTEKQRALVEELSKELGTVVPASPEPPGERSFMDKLKDFFS